MFKEKKGKNTQMLNLMHISNMFDQFMFAIHNWASFHFLSWFPSNSLHKISDLFSSPPQRESDYKLQIKYPSLPQLENPEFQIFRS